MDEKDLVGRSEPQKFDHIDVAITELADLQTEYQAHIGVDREPTAEELEKERKFVRRIDWHIMPLLLVTYGFQVRRLFTAHVWTDASQVCGQDIFIVWRRL